ncbi:hypothetical protein BBJ28_00022308 [Nothophytophthora sp. Chile5]|nr:hypothetical protein BBJ28_00022308 [Nothophytophthora sp. Chile5]
MRSDQSMYPGESNAQRPNFRQVGTKATGAVLRGAAALKHLPPDPNLVRCCMSTIAERSFGNIVRLLCFQLIFNRVCFHQKVSSIPSKFETVLHRDVNERNGFGNRTLRFGENEVRFENLGVAGVLPSVLT